jgi:hypothetical protein
MKFQSIDYTLVEEYLDQEMECDPGMLMNGITPLYKQVAAHFRPKDRKHSIYSRQSIRQAVRDYYEEHNVDHKILVKMIGNERNGLKYSPAHRAKISDGVRASWTPEKRLECSKRVKEYWRNKREL